MHDEAKTHFATKALAASVKKAAEDAARAAAQPPRASSRESRRSGSPFGTRPKPKDTLCVTPDPLESTDEERSPTD
eukprot:1576639-Heterocapsa_arctica.AAC.1